jgi:hypothetical protein
VANYRVSTNTNNSSKTTQDKTKTNEQRISDQLSLFTFKPEFLKISVDLQTAFAAETHLAEGKCPEKQLSVVKLHMFRAGTRMYTVSRIEGQNLAALKILIKN